MATNFWTPVPINKLLSWNASHRKPKSSPAPNLAEIFFKCCAITRSSGTTPARSDWKVSAIPACAPPGPKCPAALIPTIPNTPICRFQRIPTARHSKSQIRGDPPVPAKIFDAIVVGTGAGGGMAMKLLCEAGLSVLALNSGPRTDPAKHYRMHRQPFDLKYRGLGNPLSLAGRAHQEHYSVEEGEYTEGPELFEHDIAYSNAPGTDWYWKRCKGTGGKANFWGRSSARYGDIDFKAASRDGFGEDWPLDYAEIAPWFSKAEEYMGVASTIQNRPSNPDGEYLPQIPWRCLDYIIQEAGKKIGVPYLPDRCAQLTVAHNGHPACHYCGNCTRGCDQGSFFSPTWFTIPDAEHTKNLTLLTDALVRAVLVDQNGHATSLAYVDCHTKREFEAFAKVVVLAASCVETAHIMLNSKSRHWPTGIANSSGMLGKNLIDHLYGCPGYGVIPRLVGQPPPPDNIADSTVRWMPPWPKPTNPRKEKFIRGDSVYVGGGCGEFPGHYS